MNASEAINTALSSTQGILNWFLGDLSDADLLMRPTPESNHIAWQVGHLIFAEVHLLKDMLPGVQYPELPAGFAEQHNKEAAAKAEGFLPKERYLELFNQTREATKAAVKNLTDADFDRPNTGTLASFAPTLGALLLLQSNHTLMHGGQFSVVRRKLNKPVLF